MEPEVRRSARLFLALTGASLVLAGIAYLVFPRVAVGLVGIELPRAAAVIDVRATYGGMQIALGLFLLGCRARVEAARAGLTLILLVSACLASARIVGSVLECEYDLFNAVGAAAESGLAAVASLLLRGNRYRLVPGEG